MIVSLMRLSQYFVSLAERSEIEKKYSRFFLEFPDLPSITLAPIEVELRNNWSINE